MKKKLFFSTLCFILLLIMMLSTTMAWFTDTEAHVNTMVAGKISITQTVKDEQVTIVPTVEIDRTIAVTNDGNLPCYVRTLIAFEDAVVAGTDKTLVDYLDLGTPSLIFPKDTDGKKIQYTRDGVTYTIGYYVHGELADGDTYSILKEVILKKDAPSAWNEASGDHYQIMVLSQAVQTAGFEPQAGVSVADAAAAALNDESVFGKVNAVNVNKWFDTVNP